MRRRTRPSALLLAGLSPLALAVPAAAQQEDPTEQAQTPPPPTDIIVTARRLDETLDRAAVPVSVATGEEIVASGLSGTERLFERFPALTVQPTGTGHLLFIRGVGNFTLQPNSDPAVGFAYDGIFIGRPMGTMSQFFDLDRIELLKGPQGVLYGRNASAGSINLEPRQPVLGETSALLHLSGGSYAQRSAEAAINLATGSRSALRFSGAMSAQDHYLAGYDQGPDQRSLRAQWKGELGDSVTVRLSGDVNWLGGMGVGTAYVGNYVYVPAESRFHFVESAVPYSQGIYSNASQAYRQTIFLGAAGRNLDAIGSFPEQDHVFYGLHARVDADLGFGKLVVIPAWRRSDLDAVVSGSPFGYGQLEENEQSSLEARLSGQVGPIDWLAGAFHFDERLDVGTITNLSSSLILSDQNYRTRSLAGFGNLTFRLSERLRVGGGIRWTRDRKRFHSDSTSFAISCPARAPGRPSCPNAPLFPLVESPDDIPFPVPAASGGRTPILVGGVPTGASVSRTERSDSDSLTDSAATWRLSAEADLGPRTLLYAAVETGYRPGGFNGGAIGLETYQPERIRAFTLGLRHRGFADRLRLDLEAFHWNYRDQQVSSLRPDLGDPPRNVNITDNIASSRISGVEVDLRLQPWSGSRVGAIVQYLHSEYRNFRYVQALLGTPPLTGCPIALNSPTTYMVDCTGKRPYNSPRWTARLDASQSVALGQYKLTLAADTHFRSARNVGFAFLPEQRVGRSWSSNAQLILTAPGGQAEMAAFVRNIEGDRVPLFMVYHPVSNAMVATLSPPRQFGLRGSVRF